MHSGGHVAGRSWRQSFGLRLDLPGDGCKVRSNAYVTGCMPPKNRRKPVCPQTALQRRSRPIPVFQLSRKRTLARVEADVQRTKMSGWPRGGAKRRCWTVRSIAELGVTPGHRITSFARNKIGSGMVIPSAFAVFRFTTKSYLVGCSIGRSPGLAPLRILST